MVANASEKSLKDALMCSMKDNAIQVAMTEESRVLLQSLFREDITRAVSDGIRQALSPEVANAFAEMFIAQMKSQANQQLNTWSGGLVREFFKKFFYFAFFGSLVYNFGGWSALAAFGKWLVASFTVIK